MSHENQNNKLVIDAINSTKDKLLDEQNTYRAILEKPSNDGPSAESTFFSISWGLFLERMKDYNFPPDEEALKKYLRNPQNFKIDTINRIKQIEDVDMQHDIYFLDQINEHTKSLKVLAELHYQFGALEHYTQIALHWIRYSQCEMILQEVTDKSELISKDSSRSLLERDATTSMLILMFLLGIKFSEEDVCTSKNTPDIMLEDNKK